MDEEIKKVLTIEVNGDQTVKGLKEEINLLRDALLNVEKGSDDYKKVLERLIDDQKRLTEVMSAGKKEITAAAGSYNALSQEMSALKKVWKEVTDETARAEIGKRILEINNELKEMDASIGVFSRNVGDYTNSIVDASKLILGNLGQISPVLGQLGGQISSMIPLIQKTTKVATTSLKGIKAAIASTGIGALIISLGLLVSNWRKVTDAIIDHIPRLKEQKDAINDITTANNAFLTSLQNINSEIDFEATLMRIQGESKAAILQFRYEQTQALIEQTKAQIENYKAARAATIENLSMWDTLKGRIFYGIKYTEVYTDEIKSLETELANLEKQSNNLFNEIRLHNFEILNGSGNTTTTSSQKRIKIEKEELDKRLSNLNNFIEQAKRLTESYYTEEQNITKKFTDEQKTAINGLYADVITELRKSKFPSQIEDNLLKFNKFPKKLQEKISSAFKNLDLSKSGAEITNDLRSALDSIDLDGLSDKLQKEFKNLINSININDVNINIVDELNEALSSGNFDKLAEKIRELYPDNAEMQAIVNRYKELNEQIIKDRERAEKELHTERIQKNAETLVAIREQEEKNAEDLINLQLREQNALRGDKAEDRIQQLLDEQEAENKIYDERIKSYENYIALYKEIANDEQATDEARKEAAANVAQAEIEMQNLVTEKLITNLEKQNKVKEEQVAKTKEMIDDITDFANKVGDILGSIADYWMDYVNDQIKAGDMSKEEGERQFKWIKTLQIAQTTIQTLAAAMAAFNGITSSTGGWGIAAAAAEMAAVIATGAMQIAKIKATTLQSESSNNISQGAQIRTITTDFQPNYVAAQTGQSETDNLANAVSQQPIYVNVVEVENMMNNRKVRTVESTF